MNKVLLVFLLGLGCLHLSPAFADDDPAAVPPKPPVDASASGVGPADPDCDDVIDGAGAENVTGTNGDNPDAVLEEAVLPHN